MKKTILIVDDSKVDRKILKEALKQYAIKEADNGIDAVKIAKRDRPDLILLDQLMPKMDGLNALCEIMGIIPEAKCVMCTSMESVQLCKSALKSGMLDYIVKPIDTVQLQESVDRLLKY